MRHIAWAKDCSKSSKLLSTDQWTGWLTAALLATRSGLDHFSFGLVEGRPLAGFLRLAISL